MSLELSTPDDLEEFRTKLLADLKQFLNPKKELENKKWLKGYEVRAILNISPGTLQNFRVKGILSFTRMGGIIFYNANDINKLLESNHSNFKRK